MVAQEQVLSLRNEAGHPVVAVPPFSSQSPPPQPSHSVNEGERGRVVKRLSCEGIGGAGRKGGGSPEQPQLWL